MGRHLWPHPRGVSNHHSTRLWVTSGKTSASAFALQHYKISTPKKHVLSLQIEKSMRTIFILEKNKTRAEPSQLCKPKDPCSPEGHE